jgi:hypothetical protein
LAPATGKAGLMRIATKLAAGLIGGALGGGAGDAVGKHSYKLRGKKAPPAYEPPELGFRESIARGAGNFAGAAAGAALGAPGGLVGSAVGSTIGSIGGEEMAAAAYNYVSGHYGNDLAARVQRWI